MRILQGLGGAMMVPVGRLIVLHNTPKERLAQTLAYISWPGMSALVLGPPIGGFITTYTSWHWILLMNLPLGITAVILTFRWIENVRSHDHHSFDWLTFLFGAAASTGAVYGMENSAANPTTGSPPPRYSSAAQCVECLRLSLRAAAPTPR